MAISRIEEKRDFISPGIDFLFVGGLSILVSVICHVFFQTTNPSLTSSVSNSFHNFNFLVNWPHFLISYFLLYGAFNGNIRAGRPGYLWVAIMVPLILFGLIIGLFVTRNLDLLRGLVIFMYITVIWHYAKQTYGMAVVMSLKRGYYFDLFQKWGLRIHLMSIGVVNWLWSNGSERAINYAGLEYHTFGTPTWLYYLSIGVWGASLLSLVIYYIRQYIVYGTFLPINACIAILAFEVWWLPILYNEIFYAYMVPFFHSLQYLLIAVVFRYQSVTKESASIQEELTQRKRFAYKFVAYLALVAIFGVIFFEVLPNFLDSRINFFPGEGIKIELFYILIVTSINIHHYFIDNIIWKKDNKKVADALFT